MEKALAAFRLGIISLFLALLVGEGVGGVVGAGASFVLMAVYFFICQFRLSRGNPEAWRKDWPVMLALDAIWIIALFFMILSGKREVVLGQGLGIVISCFGATWAGAWAASLRARHNSVR